MLASLFVGFFIDSKSWERFCMLDWNKVQAEYNSMIEKLSGGSLDNQERASLQKRSSQYSEILGLHKQIAELESAITQNEMQSHEEHDVELKALFVEELEEQRKSLTSLTKELEQLLYPADERDSRSVYLEIRSGAGGQEAALFASDLFKMYSMFADSKRWTISIVEINETDIGGFSKLIAYFKGKNVFRVLKFESGVHRVQRVPKTETQGRVHTSTVTVAVMPEVEDIEVNINPADLRVDVFRSSGAGGQHVNTTDSAVRITHIPTGVVVTCQDERSQIKNKAKAMKALQARIYEAEREKKEAEMSAERKKQIGSGERSEKIRTYNYPQNRVTDHRTGVTLKKLDLVMQGDMPDLLEPLLEWDLQQRRERGSLLGS
jgi:peptide chain release factor 1